MLVLCKSCDDYVLPVPHWRQVNKADGTPTWRVELKCGRCSQHLKFSRVENWEKQLGPRPEPAPPCNQCDAIGTASHLCPYAEEFHDSKQLCNCCDKCTKECDWVV